MNRRLFDKQYCTTRNGWLWLALILAFNFLLRWHLREMPLERDEGEYAYAGQLLLQGFAPYQIAWNMKFPGTYYAYAALMSAFGQTPAGIHLGMILVTSLSVVLVFLIGRKVMNPVGGLVAAALFTLLSALPFANGLAGHATHFVVLFGCAGTFSLLRAGEKKSLAWTFVSGAAFGGAILMKQHAIFFCAAAGAAVLWQQWRLKEKILKPAGVFVAGTMLPFLLTLVVLVKSGVWERFTYWTIQYARQYVSMFPLSAVPRQIANGFGPIFTSGVWVWLFGGAALALIFFPIRQRRAAAVGAGLFLAALAAACPGLYFRGHYFLMAMPGLALLNAALLLALADKLKQFPQVRLLKFLPAGLFLVLAGELVARNSAIWFGLSPEQISREVYGFSPFPESPAIARYIAAHSEPDDTIVVLGSEPQIYFLARRHSASGYIYLYPLTEPQPLAKFMQDEFIHEIETARPKYVVYVNTLSSWCSVVIPGETGKTLDRLNQWWTGYAVNYRLAGVVDTAEDKASKFFWDDQLPNRTNTLPASISIFERK